MICPSDNSCPINSLEVVTAAQHEHTKIIVLLQSDPSSLIPDFFFLKERCVECLTRTCSDKVYSVPFLPCSNFQSSAMFEGSERVEVEGGSTESTVASSISACKKVNKTMCLCWDDILHVCSVRPCLSAMSVHLSIMSFSPLICCVCVQLCKRFSFPPLGCPWHPGVV